MLLVLPTRIEEEAGRTQVPVANGLIIAANVLLFFMGFRMPVGPGTSLMSVVGYAFSHASPTHLIINMWLLLVIGNAVNRRLGDAYYIMCYFGTVAALGMFARIFAGSYLVGSSGAVFSVIAVMALLLPGVRAHIGFVAVFPLSILVGLILPPRHWLYWLIRWDTVGVRAWLFLFLAPLIQLAGLFWWRGNWSNLAHLFGFVCGICFVLLLPDRLATPGRARYGVPA